MLRLAKFLVIISGFVFVSPAYSAVFALTSGQLLYKRMNGVTLPATDPLIVQIQDKLTAGDAMGAARIATDTKTFFTVTMKQFASVMATKEETPDVPLNDFQAMIIGITRDEMDARKMLTGDFIYRTSNGQTYDALERGGADFRTTLIQGPNPNAARMEVAGALTTLGWAQAHLSAGTNRRGIEYTFREFLCVPMTQWRDVSAADTRIRRDVDRAPGGNPANFQSECRGCHASMDAMGGAFARYDYLNNQLVYYVDRIAPKLNQNAQVYPEGFVTIDDSWTNFATQNQNQAFGWRGALKGYGLKAFGQMIADSQQFKTCMVQRTFSQVCRRAPKATESKIVERLAGEFETDGYNLRKLFMKVALESVCAE